MLYDSSNQLNKLKTDLWVYKLGKGKDIFEIWRTFKIVQTTVFFCYQCHLEMHLFGPLREERTFVWRNTIPSLSIYISSTPTAF